MKTIRMGCLPAKGCGSAESPEGKLWSRSLCQSVRLQSWKRRGEWFGKLAHDGAPYYISVAEIKKGCIFVSLLVGHLPGISVPISLMGYLKLRSPPREGRHFFVCNLVPKQPNFQNKKEVVFILIFESLSANGVQILIFPKK